ncbi:hypothetical protein L2E82_12842 [Cichorium intybus]|uniref:Uncharacterized protein n=1 Tax=Cichorium intybus TaxID=13427 RepID=A0ACB9GIG8_CICIN|nr:hypothetical protein L2E82_12842 [Cichorium intybus]
MDKPKPDQSPDKEETEPLVHTEKHQSLNKETHGLRDDIDANTPISDVKGPNVFERVKEEFEAIAVSIHPSRDKNQDSPSSIERGDTTFTGTPSKLKIQNLRVQTETRKEKSPHHKETHGRGEEIDVNTPISEFKGPSIFHRAKEEIEAIVDTINTKKETERNTASPKKESGLKSKISKLKIETNKEKSPHHKETHGRGEEIDVNTPISEFKGPSIFHRAKEEFEAIVDTMNTKKESASPKKEGGFKAKINKLKIENMKVQTETSKEKSPVAHYKETHGRGEEIDVDTPISEFKGPSIFHRAKEEIEAIVDTIQSKKESESPKKEGGFRASVSKKFHRVYSKGRNHD